MTEITNLTDLRNLQIITETVFVKGYSNSGDGGGGLFLWRSEPQFQTGEYSFENYGTIIKSNIVPNNQGSWVRQYDGFINVLYFGALGVGNDYTLPLQRAIDFAKLNSKINPLLKGYTVFIPNGSYTISNIMLKSGINIIGETLSKTIIYSPGGTASEYLFEIESGPVFINISNLNIVGNNTEKGCFLFESESLNLTPFHGGLWNFKISNIVISKFRGNCIHLKGGGIGSNFLIPNQFNIFENIRITKTSDFSYALLMSGQNGQTSFINCTFDGFRENGTYSKGQNVRIENVEQYYSAIISFINCTCHNSDYGIYIGFAQNITIDSCWFENLGVAITIKSNVAQEPNDVQSKCINIVNNRFANASGFGSLDVPNNIKPGQCISVDNSFVNVINNYTTVSDPDGQHFDENSKFLNASNNSSGNVNIANNAYQKNILGKTFGIMQVINVFNDTLNCYGHKEIFVNSSNDVITTIISSINASETISIRANGGTITFRNSNNIFFMTTNPDKTFSLENGETATFIKVDNIVGNNYETYQLISILKTLS